MSSPGHHNYTWGPTILRQLTFLQALNAIARHCPSCWDSCSCLQLMMLKNIQWWLPWRLHGKGKKKKKKARCIKLHCICAGAGLGAAAFSFLQNAMVNHGQNTHNFNQGKRGNIDTRIPWRSNKERWEIEKSKSAEQVKMKGNMSQWVGSQQDNTFWALMAEDQQRSNR